MTDKERIEWALKHWSDLPELKCSFCGKVFRGDHECDYEYLKKRVQELENEIKTHAPHGRNYTNEQVVKIRMQNKRYREAREILEQIYKENYVKDAYGYEDGYLDGLDTAVSIIDKALEESE